METPIAPTAPSPKSLRDYRSEYLRLGSVQTMVMGYVPGGVGGVGVGGVGGVGYTTASQVQVEGVLRGGATMLSPMTFAKLVGDTTTQQKLHSRRVSGLSLIGVGSAVLLGGVAIGLSDPDINEAAVGVGLAGGVATIPGAIIWGTTMNYRYWYTRSRAQARIDAYNEKLRKRLNLSEQDTVEIDTQ